MIFRFDLFRLGLLQRENLRQILDVIQSENVGEIVVFAVELPYKFWVLTDNTIEYLECVGASPVPRPRAISGARDQDDHRR